MNILVMAKEPVAGRVKTRLSPPFTLQQAAQLASAALADTFAAALQAGADEVIVALDGEPGDWIPPDIRVIKQVDGPFDQRLSAAWSEVGGPTLQIGMDTPQVTPAQLASAANLLMEPDTDAIIGAANDGGWWILGLHEPVDGIFEDIPMSVPETGARQRDRLAQLGLHWAEVEVLVDVDTYHDAELVARSAPTTTFAQQFNLFASTTS